MPFTSMQQSFMTFTELLNINVSHTDGKRKEECFARHPSGWQLDWNSLWSSHGLSMVHCTISMYSKICTNSVHHSWCFIAVL